MKNILFLIIFFLTISCNPYETPSSGENSFYCEINEEPYHPKMYRGLTGRGTPFFVNYYSNSEVLDIFTVNIDTNYSIQIHLNFFEGVNEYSFYSHYEYDDIELNNYITITRGFINNNEIEIITYITSDNPANAYLEITEFDGENKFIGNFNATLYNVDDIEDIIIINNGRFDINLETLY